MILKTVSLPAEFGPILDIAPINRSLQSDWIVLAGDGQIFQFNAELNDFVRVAVSSVPPEPDHDPWAGHTLRKRLHVSNGGEFIAVVNDYGRYGEVIDARTGQVTLNLDGGDYHPETVPLSFAFADMGTSVVAIHRTEWNRLDFSDPASGKLLSDRGPTSYKSGEKRPERYLDYFHGALYVDPSSQWIVDDGWHWHPVGVPQSWGLGRWLSENVWESEDGLSKKDVCAREYYWDHAITWLDGTKIVIEGIGNDDSKMIAGARVFDITKTGKAGPEWRDDWEWALEIATFPGPAGKFFSDGLSLFSSSSEGLTRWRIEDGARTGHLPDFRPAHHHRGARELVELNNSVLTRWCFDDSMLGVL